MKFFQTHLSPFFKALSRTQQRVLTWIFLQLIFLLGLGITSVVGRMLKKKFLGEKSRLSSWKKHSGIVDLRKMF